MRQVILTDTNGQERGTAALLDAHTGEGMLHRAFSAYIFRNNRKEILIQKRSSKKMLWPGIWANTCCSHPFPGEDIVAAGERRLREECSITCTLTPQGTFVYRALDPQGRGIEHEHVTILVGDVEADTEPDQNPDEIEEMKWISTTELLADMERNPDIYAPWFHKGLRLILDMKN